MRLRVWPGLFTLGVAICGCGQPSSPSAAAHNVTSPTATAPNDPAATEAAPRASAPTSALPPAAPPKEFVAGKPSPPPSPAATKSELAAIQQGEAAWGPTQMTPLGLATKMDNAYRTVEGEVCTQNIGFELPVGSGTDILTAKIALKDKFSVEYTSFTGVPVTPHRHRVIASGGEEIDFNASGGNGNKNYGPKHPYTPGGEADGPELLSRWISDFPTLSMGHFITGKDVFLPLVRTMLLPGSGFVTKCQQRTVKDRKGADVIEYRIVASRTKGAATKFGDAGIEIVVNGVHFVPVVMASKAVHLEGKTQKLTQIHWQGHWGPGKMVPKDFAIP